MIPSVEDDLTEDLEQEDEPSLTYGMILDTNRIKGYVDDAESVKQAIYKILNTERYEYIIYSWDYGIELIDLYGEDDTFVIPELKRRIEEALLMDERIESCTDFKFDTSIKGVITVTFTANTIYGDIDIEQAVNMDV